MSNTRANERKSFEFRLDLESGVPVYRQIIDQVMGGMAAGRLAGGHQLPTVRQVAVELEINSNTLVRAYRELEIRGVLETQQGTGTFISQQKVKRDDLERQRQLNQLVGEFVSRAGGHQLPTGRQMAVDLEINPNTVVRAYRELEIRGVLETQQGTGTFISQQKVKRDDLERQRQLNQLVGEFVSRAGAAGFSIGNLVEQLNDRQNESQKNRR